MNGMSVLYTETETEKEQWMEHSVILNRIAWTAAKKLGLVIDGDGAYEGDVESLILQAMGIN